MLATPYLTLLRRENLRRPPGPSCQSCSAACRPTASTCLQRPILRAAVVRDPGCRRKSMCLTRSSGLRDRVGRSNQHRGVVSSLSPNMGHTTTTLPRYSPPTGAYRFAICGQAGRYSTLYADLLDTGQASFLDICSYYILYQGPGLLFNVLSSAVVYYSRCGVIIAAIYDRQVRH